MTSGLLDIVDLNVSYATLQGGLKALDQITLSAVPSETVAVVGESGSGKSTLALAVMGLLGAEANVTGLIRFQGRDLATLDPEAWRRLRGRSIGMVFQDPFTSLNPGLPVGEQVMEPLLHHFNVSRAEARHQMLGALSEVGLTDVASLARAYPHQLSGGMQQRVLIAGALICNPDLLILDEPTTALDVTIEAQILDLLGELRRKRRLSMLFITHNFGVVNRIADRVCVLYAGRVAELGTKDAILHEPAHPYTKGLLASLPRLSAVGRPAKLAPIPGRFPDLTQLPSGCIFAPRCPFRESKCNEPQALIKLHDGRAVRCWKAMSLHSALWPRGEKIARIQRERRSAQPQLVIRDLAKTYRVRDVRAGIEWKHRFGILPWPNIRQKEVHAVDGVTLHIERGEVLGLVGESGSGKTTLGRSVLRLIEPTSGSIDFDRENITALPPSRLKTFRKRAQIVFQNPDSSLNPRRTVGDAIARAAKLHATIGAQASSDYVKGLLQHVGLQREYYDRYPHQLSGGEKQRVGIARALATEPAFIVCDEPLSALDVSVQATVLNLLEELRGDFGLSYLFISHDLSVVAHIADRIAVMYAGRICEEGPVEAVLAPPYHPYTEALLSAVSSPVPAQESRARIRLRDDPGLGEGPAVGCPFSGRCPRKIGRICEEVAPPVIEPSPGHTIACHIPLEQLVAAAAIDADPTSPHAAAPKTSNPENRT
jgi:peptide/nickel transport system ATP-binding protein